MTKKYWPSVLPELVGLDQVRVVEPRREARLVAEHPDVLRVARELLMEGLEDEQLLDARRARQGGEEDACHSALAEQRDLAVSTEPHRVNLGPMGPSETVPGREYSVRLPSVCPVDATRAVRA